MRTFLTLPSFSDRDMLMRYVGGAVGHSTTSEASQFFGKRTFAYSQKFSDRRKQELAGLSPIREGRTTRETAYRDEEHMNSDDNRLDDGGREQSDDSDYMPESDDENNDFAYAWKYPSTEKDERGKERGGVRQGDDVDVEVDGEDGNDESDNEVQAMGYDDN